MKTWRLIIEGANPASYNMAADAYLLEAAETPGAMPVLRLYGWAEPSITIGYHQTVDRAVDPTALGPTPVVRRVTGGRALLHDDGELTYAVAGNFIDNNELGATLHDSYDRISEAIVAFYDGLGCPARISHRDAPVSLGRGEGVQKGCFAAVSHHEILIGDDKMAAGSQRRGATVLLQHGAVKLIPPRPHPAIRELPQLIANEQLNLLRHDRRELQAAFSRAVGERFGVAFEARSFTPSEVVAIQDKSVRFKNLNNE